MRYRIVIQFPFADVRRIIGEAKTQRLASPTWPQPEVRRQFVRNFGQVRSLHGVYNEGIWPGSDVFCDARHALRLPALGQVFKGKAAAWVSRRFFSSGLEVCWYELGFTLAINGAPEGAAEQHAFEGILKAILNHPVHITRRGGKPLEMPLLEAGDALAASYLEQSTRFQATEREKWWVKAGEPVVLTTTPAGFVPPDLPPTAVRSADFAGIGVPDIYHYRQFSSRDFPYSCWRLLHSPDSAFSDETSSLRTNILRLHVEKECLKRIMTHIMGNRFTVERDHPESQHLQQYLAYSLKKLNSGREEALQNRAIVEKIFQLDTLATQDERRKIMQLLQTIRSRLFTALDAFFEQRLAEEAG